MRTLSGWCLQWLVRYFHTLKPAFKTTWEIGTTWELRTATSVPRSTCIQYLETDLRNKTTSEFRTVFHSPLGVPNSQVPLYLQDLNFGEVSYFSLTRRYMSIKVLNVLFQETLNLLHKSTDAVENKKPRGLDGLLELTTQYTRMFR